MYTTLNLEVRQCSDGNLSSAANRFTALDFLSSEHRANFVAH